MGPSAADPTAKSGNAAKPARTVEPAELAARPGAVNRVPSHSRSPLLRVAVDATPLVHRRTGVGVMTAALFDQLARSEAVDLHGYVVSGRARSRSRQAVPEGATARRLVWPARLAHLAWQRFDQPRLGGTWDVVHGTNYVVPPTGSGIRLVTVHDLTAWRFPDLVDRHSRAYPALLRRAVAGGAAVHCVSDAVGREVIHELGIDGGRVHVIPNGFDPVPPGDPAAARRLVGAPYVLAIGTIEPRKDYVGLIRAMAAVWSDHPDTKLVIIGGDGWGVDDFERTVADLKAADRVVRVGYATERHKADLMAGAELLAYPSVYEGFGLPVLEAMQLGLPVVATEVDAVAEVAAGAALLVPPGEPQDLAAAISAVLTDDDRRAHLIGAGRRRAAAYSWDRTGSAMIGLYRRLTGQPDH